MCTTYTPGHVTGNVHTTGVSYTVLYTHVPPQDCNMYVLLYVCVFVYVWYVRIVNYRRKGVIVDDT